MKRQIYLPGHMLLSILQEFLDVPHGGVQQLSFMQPVSVPHGQLVFPVELPFGEYMFFQRMVGLDDQQGCGGFETYSSLDADYGVSYRSEEHTSELQSLMRISYAVFSLKKKRTSSHPIYSVT